MEFLIQISIYLFSILHSMLSSLELAEQSFNSLINLINQVRATRKKKFD